MKTIRIGAGAGYAGDRVEPAVELAREGDLDYLVFECLAERTIALAQQARARDPRAGYDPLLAERMEACLGICLRRHVKIITNMGAANPREGARVIAATARRLGVGGLKIAAVLGDDVLDLVRRGDYPVAETGGRVSDLGDAVIAANAYLGAERVVEALRNGADVVITGRVADPSLFVAPAIHEFGWPWEDWDLLGQATVMGHLLECAGQVTGGYFADPGYKDVPGLERLGFPLAEVRADGSFVVTKVPEAGGMVTAATCKEQLLYEIHDPARYVTPDVVADFTAVRIEETGKDRVLVTGGRGRPRTDTLKVSIGYRDGYMGEGQISYGGPGAEARGRLALEIVMARLRQTGIAFEDLRGDLIGVSALHGGRLAAGHDPYEVRLRVAARARTLKDAARVGNEVEALYTNGPAGGAGAVKAVREVLSVASTLIPRALAPGVVHYEEVR